MYKTVNCIHKNVVVFSCKKNQLCVSCLTTAQALEILSTSMTNFPNKKKGEKNETR